MFETVHRGGVFFNFSASKFSDCGKAIYFLSFFFIRYLFEKFMQLKKIIENV